jgi:multimeric flavodoxin WrbA
MRILALNGSPRKEGNTAKLLKEMTKDHAGVDLDYFDLNDLKIKDCQACFYCKKNDACAIKDDMQTLYRKLREADALVLGSPIYFSVETANTRAFIDRMYAMLAFGDGPGKYVPRLSEGKKAIVVITCGNAKGKEVYANVRERMFATWGSLGFKEVHPYIIGGASPQGNVMELVDAQNMLGECRELLGDL